MHRYRISDVYKWTGVIPLLLFTMSSNGFYEHSGLLEKVDKFADITSVSGTTGTTYTTNLVNVVHINGERSRAATSQFYPQTNTALMYSDVLDAPGTWIETEASILIFDLINAKPPSQYVIHIASIACSRRSCASI